MEWKEIVNPRGYIYAYTYVERGGTGLELPCPYYQIDVKLDGVCTIPKSYLVGRGPIKIGDKVRARFRTGPLATHTCLDLYWELHRAKPAARRRTASKRTTRAGGRRSR
jgi:uncharacterized OB-fold protein